MEGRIELSIERWDNDRHVQRPPAAAGIPDRKRRLFAFAGAEKGHILLDKPLQTAASELCDSVFSEYHTVVDGVAVDYVYTDTIIDSTRTQYSYTLTLRRVQG